MAKKNNIDSASDEILDPVVFELVKAMLGEHYYKQPESDETIIRTALRLRQALVLNGVVREANAATKELLPARAPLSDKSTGTGPK